jgi:hypothetical protein
MNQMITMWTLKQKRKRKMTEHYLARNYERTTKTVQKKVVISVIIISAIIFVYQTGSMTDAKALTRYDNCTSRVANKNGTLSLQNVENCYGLQGRQTSGERRGFRNSWLDV